MKTIGIIGTKGNLITRLLDQLYERKVPKESLYLLDSGHYLGQKLSYGEDTLTVQALEHFKLNTLNSCFMLGGSNVSKEWTPKLVEQGVKVIDSSGAFRGQANAFNGIPLVNGQRYQQQPILMNPNCNSVILLNTLKPIHDQFTLKRVIVTSLNSVSGAGKEAMDTLFYQTKNSFMGITKATESAIFTKPIAFNLIPAIGDFMKDGYTEEEWKFNYDTHTILSSKIDITATSIRVPVFIGHSMVVNFETEQPILPEDCKAIWETLPYMLVWDELQDNGYASPLDVVNDNTIAVSRLRMDTTLDNGISMFITADNLRVGIVNNLLQLFDLSNAN